MKGFALMNLILLLNCNFFKWFPCTYICYAFQYKPQGSIVYKQKKTCITWTKTRIYICECKWFMNFVYTWLLYFIFLWLRESYIIGFVHRKRTLVLDQKEPL